MRELTKQETAMLNRMPITLSQRQMIEEHWKQKEENKTPLAPKILIMSVPWFSLAIFAGGHSFFPEITPLVNLALFLIWFLYIMLVAVVGLVAARAMYLEERGEKTELLDKIFISTLEKIPGYMRLHGLVVNTALIVVLVMLGYVITALMVALTLTAAKIILESLKAGVKTFLDELDKEQEKRAVRATRIN